jgi:hypothetical protein
MTYQKFEANRVTEILGAGVNDPNQFITPPATCDYQGGLITRHFNTVTLQLWFRDTTTSTTQTLGELPYGWRPIYGSSGFMNIADGSSASKYVVVTVDETGKITYRNNDASWMRGSLSWITMDDPQHGTLPTIP